MNVIGINCFLHDSAAALVKNGKIIAAAEEERFNRLKHTDKFPILAIKYCLKQAGLDLSEIDHLAFYMKPLSKIYHLGIKNYFKHPFDSFAFLKGEIYNSSRMLSLRLYLRDFLGMRPENIKKNFIIHVDHHLAHISSAFLASGYDESAVLSIDGCGENSTCVLAHASRNGIRVIRRINFPHSIGFVYAALTAFLGFQPLSDEYKVMGLASYGKPRFIKQFKEIIRISETGNFKIDTSYFNYEKELAWPWVSKKIYQIFGSPRREDEQITDKHKDIACSLQKCVEETGLALAKFLRQETKSDNLCLAGGVALNCAMNGKIFESGLYKNIFVQPAACDSGASLGAALWASNYYLSVPSQFDMQNAYLGPEFSEGQIEEIITTSKLRFKRYSNISEIAAKHLSEGKIIGWFQGRMEFGPRALGSRSILADPRKPEMKEIVNERIKHRELFRPFAPSILEEYAGDYFIACKRSPFMTFIFKVKEDKVNEIPAVTHIDGTARVQTVSKNDNPRFWKLINEFNKLTGVPVLLNTSFNIRGEPIVCSPEDAIKCFFSTGIDLLVLGDYILEK